jgi:hypothetical protein
MYAIYIVERLGGYMYGTHAYEHTLEGELLNEIKRLLELCYEDDPITAAVEIRNLMWEAGYMGDDEE